MSETITVFNRQSYPLICDEVGHTLAPGKSREVSRHDSVATTAIAVGEFGVIEPETAPDKNTTTTEAEAPAENEE